jgi:hypothetical protein
MSPSLYAWKLKPTNDTLLLVFAIGRSATEAAERIALRIAAVNPDPEEVSRIESSLRSSEAIHLDFSEGVGNLLIELF